MRTDITQVEKNSPIHQELVAYASSGQEGHSYDLISFNEGKFIKTSYRNRPCFGEMRPYEKTHPKEVKDGVRMPGDLHVRFPDGNPVAYGIARNMWAGNTAVQFVVDSEDSPFRSVFSLAEKIRDKNNDVIGLVFLDLDLDPTLLVHGLRYCRSLNDKLFRDYVKAGATKLEALTLLFTGQFNWSNYNWSDRNNLKRFYEGQPVNHSVNHEKYIDRAVYNRPMNEQTFHDGKNFFSIVLNVGNFNKETHEGKVKVLRSVLPTLE